MKRILISAAAAVILLSGCSEGGGNSRTTSAGSGGSLAAGSAQSASATQQAEPAHDTESSKSGAPTVIAPNFLGSSSQNTEQSNPVPDTEQSEVSELIGNVIDFGEVYTVTDELRIENGMEFYVRGTLDVPSGTVIVEDGGALIVSGKITMYGDNDRSGTLILSEDSYLMIGEGGVNGVIESGVIEMHCDFDRINCEEGTVTSFIKVPERKVINGVTTVGGIVIANKAIKLPPEFGSHLSLDEVEPEVYQALEEMNYYSSHEYVNKSGYRSYWDQKAIFENYCDMYGYEEADTFSSQAGHSEHQTGLTMDLDDFEESYGYTPEGIWLAENCWKYGFIIRYPKGKEYITGYTYEPWHVRWLGKSTAKLFHDSGYETLEEFLNVEGGLEVID